jgi:tripeptidyl-peptidase-1
VLAATGDDGVAGYKARNDTAQCKYTASFPATCPYVTSVGGTQNAENDPEDHEVHTLKEWAANAPEQQGPFFKITTAGGFSNYFARTPCQNASVAKYMASPEAARAAAGYNTTGRGFPDVATNSINFQIYITSFRSLVQGTSGSSPSLGGLISAANAARKKAGKKAKFGWIAPLMYANPGVMNDVSHGYNNCTAVVAFCCGDIGFTGRTGWDPLVGLGSPSYLRLTNLM